MIQKPLQDIVSVVFLSYSVFSIIRSFGAIYLTFKEVFSQEDGLFKDELLENIHLFNTYYHFIPYIIGICAIPFLKRFFKINWLNYLLGTVLGLILFRFIDSSIIRPLFGIFQNTIVNILLQLVLFSMLGFLAIRISSKEKG